jgi:hypothetical protein
MLKKKNICFQKVTLAVSKVPPLRYAHALQDIIVKE